MPSSQYKLLKRELYKAKRAFLPITFNPLGIYPEKVSDRSRGFLLASHAEIESYIENIVRATAAEAVSKWMQQKTPTLAMASLLAYNFLEEGEPRWRDISFRVNHAHNKFDTVVKGNNGIKPDNLRSLLMPIGIDINALDNLFLSEIESFAESRGKAAHTSNNQATGRNIFDPKIEHDRVFVKLLPQIKILDAEFPKCLL